MLLLGFMVHCLMPGGPYILLFITGERGSGKSTRARVIKSGRRPDQGTTAVPTDLARRPGDLGDAAVAPGLRQRVSSIPQDMSDALCVILDGGGLGKRRLYSTMRRPWSRRSGRC